MTQDVFKITKLAESPTEYSRFLESFPSGRTAFKAILNDLAWPVGRVLLLPAFIGMSSREGSGVFDPVQELGLTYEFYRMTDTLQIDQDHLAEQLLKYPGAALLLIHYFGRVDPHYQQILALADHADAEIIEDEAHAMLTDLVGGISGRGGRHAFYSLHKLLPLKGGGARVYNGKNVDRHLSVVPDIQMYDLSLIAKARIRNYNCLAELMAPLQEWVELLWPNLSQGEVPQTFPILIRCAQTNRLFRDEVYNKMNIVGYGVVSLYHTLIYKINIYDYPESHRLANSILNLPIHQDLDPSLLPGMVDHLSALLKTLSSNHE